ncbi:MAG: helix-turn-helix domain-containing protein [Pseudomonadota bacterium]
MTTASRILGVGCLLVALNFLFPFLKLNIDNRIIESLIGWLFYIPATSGAIGYFFTRTTLSEKPFRASDLVHLAPLLFCYLLTADFLFGNSQEIAEWIAGIYSDSWRLPASEYVIVGQAFGYGTWTLSMILRYRRQAHANLANFDATVFRWLVMLQALPLAAWGLAAMPGLSTASEIYADIASLFLLALVFFIALMQWRNPQLFTIAQLTEVAETPVLKVADQPRPNQNGSVQDGELDPAIRAELFETIKKQIEGEELYLDSRLTLAGLATATGLSKHHLSEVLNRHAGKNFYEFINGYRVDFVRKRLAEDSNQKILTMALEAGFSSKSTFNAIFKQFTGQTPTQYRKGLVEVKKG